MSQEINILRRCCLLVVLPINYTGTIKLNTRFFFAPPYCVMNYMLEKGMDDAMGANRGEWKKMTCCADPK